MILYNSIGEGYNHSRKPDPRIVKRLIDLLDLPLGSVIADIGAGTGNYSNAIADKEYSVIAIEPSSIMRSQAIEHPNVRWLNARAEEIPLPDNSVNGAIIVLALHHFSDRLSAITEINRIVGDGKIVIFAFEQKKIPSFSIESNISEGYYKGFHIINLFSQRVSSQPEEQQERLTSRSSSNFKSTASYPTINA